MNKHHQLSRGVSRNELEDYLSFKKIQGNCDRWVGEIRRGLLVYLNYIDYNISQSETLAFLKSKKERYAISTYRKMIYQVRSFLLFLDVGWAKNIIPPAEPEYTPKRVSKEDIQRTIELVGSGGYGIRYVALILLGASSGMRAEELYQLRTDDIDLDKQIVYINHDPKSGQTTKTKKNRISFFNTETKNALIQYLALFNQDGKLKYLFFKRQCEKVFQNTPIHVKDLRKFFSQEWDRRGGPTSIKKMLMGHSLRGDVDLMHYNYQSEEDLKKIYDNIGIKI